MRQQCDNSVNSVPKYTTQRAAEGRERAREGGGPQMGATPLQWPDKRLCVAAEDIEPRKSGRLLCKHISTVQQALGFG